MLGDQLLYLIRIANLGFNRVPHQRAQIVQRAEVLVVGHHHRQPLGRLVEVDRQNFVGGRELRRDGVQRFLGDVDRVEVDVLIPALRRQRGVEVRVLDVAEVDKDSPQRPALALLEGQRLDNLIARDLSHLGQHATDGTSLKLIDGRHPANHRRPSASGRASRLRFRGSTTAR